MFSPPRTSRLRSTRIVFPAACLLLAGTLLALGGLPPRAACGFALGTTVLWGCVLWEQRRSTVFFSWPVVLPFLTLSLFTALQCVPLPVRWLSDVAPGNAAVWIHAALPVGSAPARFLPLSLAPELTRVETLKWVAYGVVAHVGYLTVRTHGLRPVAWLAVALASLVGLVTLAHVLLGLPAVFGIYEPRLVAARWTMGPLLNANHLSGYLSFGSFAGFGLLLASRDARSLRSAVLIITTSCLVMGVVLLASRGAVVLLVVGSLLVLLLPSRAILASHERRVSDRSRTRAPSIRWIVGMVVVAATVGFLWYRQSILLQLREKDISKLYVARDAVAMIRHYRVWGVGRGAFESAFFAYKRTPGNTVWTHPENILVQWLTEWGIPVSLVGGSLFLLPLLRQRGWRERTLGRVLGLALALLVVHNLVDYSLEVPAVAALAAFTFGALVGTRTRGQEGRLVNVVSRRRRGMSALLRWRLGGGAVAGCAVALASIAVFRSRPALLTDLRQDAFRRTRMTSAARTPEDLAALLSWSLRFPAEPYFPLTIAIVVAQRTPLGALRWVDRALECAPSLGMVRLAAADLWRAAGDPSQALLEARLAYDHDPSVAPAVGRIAAQVGGSVDDLRTLLPENGPAYDAYLESLVSSLPADAEVTAPLQATLLARRPCFLPARSANVRRRVTSDRRETCPQEQSAADCDNEIERELTSLAACPGGAGAAAMIRAQWAWLLGDRPRAIRLLEEACLAASGDNLACLETLASQAAEARDVDTMARSIRMVISRRCQGADSCGEAWGWAARIHLLHNDKISAFAAALRAMDYDSSNLGLRQLVGDTALQVGAYDRAIASYQYLIERRPNDASYARTQLALAQSMAQSKPTPSPTASVRRPWQNR